MLAQADDGVADLDVAQRQAGPIVDLRPRDLEQLQEDAQGEQGEADVDQGRRPVPAIRAGVVGGMILARRLGQRRGGRPVQGAVAVAACTARRNWATAQIRAIGQAASAIRRAMAGQPPHRRRIAG